MFLDRVDYLDKEAKTSQSCQNYLIGKETHPNMEKVIEKNRIGLYKVNGLQANLAF